MKVAPELLADLCRQHAPDLRSPLVWEDTSFDKVKLLWGLCGVESSFGFRCAPRHEQGYCYGASYFNANASAQWGCLAHCSYGPWQVMYANFPPNVSPLSLVWETDGRVASLLSLSAAIVVLNKAIERGARSYSDLVMGYNGPENKESYKARLEECSLRPLPASVVSGVDV